MGLEAVGQGDEPLQHLDEQVAAHPRECRQSPRLVPGSVFCPS
jgi:hypothetical protein